MNTVRAAAVRVMPPSTSSRNRLATPVTCRRCGMNTVRAAAVTKSGNPLCDKSHVELTLQGMPPATETVKRNVPYLADEVAV
jgi:hypothetical protein